jgi:hypothetical protein
MRRGGQVLAAILALGGGAMAQAPNDWCANATVIYNGVNPGAPGGASGNFFSNVASIGNELSPAACAPVGDTKDVWFEWTVTGAGTATLTTCTPAGFAPGTASTRISVYPWCGGSEIACSQTACGTGATASFAALLGQTVRIRVATIAPTYTGGTFYLTATSPPSPPPNDSFNYPTAVFPGANPASGTFTTIGATYDGGGPCTGFGDIDVWFLYQPGTSGLASLNTPGVSLAARVTDLAGTVVACGTTSTLAPFAVTGGVFYTIRIASQVGAGTNFTLAIVAPTPPPANDECVNAIPLVLGANGPFPASDATPSPGFPSCVAAADVWYSFPNGPCTTVYTVETCGVFGFGIMPGCNATAGALCTYGYGYAPCANSHVLVFVALANTTYRIAIPANAAHTVTITQGIHAASVSNTYLSLEMSAPLPGSLQVNALAGPPGGVWYLAATLNQGSFPFGPGYGLEMTHGEFLAQFMIGPPFTGGFDGCGNLQLGPFFGLPPGLTVYSVLFGFAGGYSLTPTIYSYPTVFTVP